MAERFQMTEFSKMEDMIGNTTPHNPRKTLHGVSILGMRGQKARDSAKLLEQPFIPRSRGYSLFI